jgi:hypothetical protein
MSDVIEQSRMAGKAILAAAVPEALELARRRWFHGGPEAGKNEGSRKRFPLNGESAIRQREHGAISMTGSYPEAHM